MTSPELDNLVRIGKLKRESASDEEVVGLLQSAEDRLNDAGRADLSYSSRFDLAYNAAHTPNVAAFICFPPTLTVLQTVTRRTTNRTWAHFRVR